MVDDDFRIWTEVLESFPEEDPEGVFDSPAWVDRIAERAQEAVRMLEAGDPIAETAVVHEYPLGVLAAVVAADAGRPLRILDFGGGMGATYVQVVASIPAGNGVDFHIVETPGVCRRGREIFGAYHDVHFHEEMPPPAQGRFDIVHCGSAFQYVKDWKGLLGAFAAYGPRYLAFGNLLAGDIKTFVTYQNSYGQKIPVRFLNLREVLKVLAELGYELVYHSLLIQKILGQVQLLPTSHMPPEHRLKYGCNLILEPGR